MKHRRELRLRSHRAFTRASPSRIPLWAGLFQLMIIIVIVTCDFKPGAGAHLAGFVGCMDINSSLFCFENFLDDERMLVVVLLKFYAIRR